MYLMAPLASIKRHLASRLDVRQNPLMCTKTQHLQSTLIVQVSNG